MGVTRTILHQGHTIYFFLTNREAWPAIPLAAMFCVGDDFVWATVNVALEEEGVCRRQHSRLADTTAVGHAQWTELLCASL